MQVRELIEMLEGMDQDAEVHFAYNYGDHCNTMVAPAVSQVEEMYVEPNAYVNDDALVDDENADEENPNQRRVVVIQ